MEHPTVDIACELFTGKLMEIAYECIGTNTVTIRPNNKISMTSEIRRELRVRDRLRKKFIESKSIFNERKYKDQCNKVINLKKSAKIEFYVSINETLSDLKMLTANNTGRPLKCLSKVNVTARTYHPNHSHTKSLLVHLITLTNVIL